MIILIPAYKPDQSLVRLARALREQDPATEILVIDDGSGSTYTPIFTELRIDGVTVQTHPVNKGKGAALRTGITWAKANRPGEVIVTADADGQHLSRDIFRVGVRTETATVAGQRSIILGVRTSPDPNAGEEGTKVPLRSKIGNSATVGFFAWRPAPAWQIPRPVCAASPRRSWTGCCRSPAISTSTNSPCSCAQPAQTWSWCRYPS